MSIETTNVESSFRCIIHFGLGLFFVVSGIDKILHPHSFIEAVHSYHILPEIIAPFFAVIIMAIESASGLALIFNWFSRAFYFLLMILLVLFSSAIIKILFEGVNIDCGCFSGIYSGTVNPWMLVRNVLLIALFVWLLRTNISGKDANDFSDRLPG